MAISKDKKQAVVAEMSELFASAKAIAVAKYQGTSVAELHELRKAARENGVVVKVVKNRLVRVAFAASETFKETDTSALQGQLIYAVSSDDEVMAAKVLNDFAKTNDKLVLKAGSYAGKVLDKAGVQSLASIPSREELLAKLLGVMKAPVSGFAVALGALAKQREGAAA